MKVLISFFTVFFLLMGCSSSAKATQQNSLAEKAAQATYQGPPLALNRGPESYSSIENLKEAKKNNPDSFLKNKNALYTLNEEIISGKGMIEVKEYIITVPYSTKDNTTLFFTQQVFEDIDFAYENTKSKSSGKNITLDGKELNIHRTPSQTIVTFTKDNTLCTFVFNAEDVSEKVIEKLFKSVQKSNLS